MSISARSGFSSRAHSRASAALAAETARWPNAVTSSPSISRESSSSSTIKTQRETEATGEPDGLGTPTRVTATSASRELILRGLLSRIKRESSRSARLSGGDLLRRVNHLWTKRPRARRMGPVPPNTREFSRVAVIALSTMRTQALETEETMTISRVLRKIAAAACPAALALPALGCSDDTPTETPDAAVTSCTESADVIGAFHASLEAAKSSTEVIGQVKDGAQPPSIVWTDTQGDGDCL